ncbi:hypothetical protein ACFQYP_24410 [Nonomuraea antimicrobica]
MDTAMSVVEAGRMFAAPAAYTDETRLHEGLARLRRESPVHRVEVPGYTPFWALTRHADVLAVERDHDLWLSAPRPRLRTADLDAAMEARGARGAGFRTIVHMDGPEHRALRAVAADWFRPRAMRAMEARVRELARRHVDRMAEHDGACDFARQVAAHYPSTSSSASSACPSRTSRACCASPRSCSGSTTRTPGAAGALRATPPYWRTSSPTSTT